MELPKEIQETINELFPDDEEKRLKLLNCDANEIQKLVLSYPKGLDAKTYIDAYKNKDSEAMKRMYYEAQKIYKIGILYRQLCIAHSQINKRDDEIR